MVQLLRYVSCLPLDDLLNSALPTEPLVVLTVFEELDQLLGGNEVVKHHYFSAAVVDKAITVFLELKYFTEMLDELQSGVGDKGRLSGCTSPVIFQLQTVPFLVLSGDLHQFGVVSGILVLFVGTSVDEVLGAELDQVLYLVSDYCGVLFHYVVDFSTAVL
jgi:hypothetical protein